MEIVCKKTTELTQDEKEQICRCFGSVFEKHSKPLSYFNNQFLNTCLGYSLHTMLKSETSEVVGLYALIPFEYVYKEQKVLFSIGVDFMIRKDFRNDFRNVMGLCKESIKFAKECGVVCIFAFPNDLSYQLNTRILRMKDVGKLFTYILPYKVGEVKPSLSCINFFSGLLSRLMLSCASLDCRGKEYEAPIHRNRDFFDESRYKWFNPEEYKFYQDDRMKCIWKCTDFDGAKAAFLMDVTPMSPKNFNKAVKEMFNVEKRNVGLFLYVGNLPFGLFSMIKIPLKFAPKNFNFVAQVLDNTRINEEDIFNINNWDVNLSSYDLL